MRRALFVLTLVACGPEPEPEPDLGTCDWWFPTDCAQGTSSFDSDGDGLINTSYTLVTLDAHTREERNDYGGDGVIDEVLRFETDDRGRDVTVSHDDDGDGSFDRIDTHTWVDEGLTSTDSLDEGTDGVVEVVVRWTYDEAGRPVEQRYDTSKAEETDFVITWAYDASGNLIEYTTDGDADGVVDFMNQTVFDDEDRRVLTTYEGRGGDSWGRTSYEVYDACGRRAVATTMQADGTWRRVEYSYDGLGRLVLLTTDLGLDGVIDSTWSTEWRDGSAYHRYDLNGDGVPEGFIERDYDAAGHEVAGRQDYGTDGQVDFAWWMPGGCQD